MSAPNYLRDPFTRHYFIAASPLIVILLVVGFISAALTQSNNANTLPGGPWHDHILFNGIVLLAYIAVSALPIIAGDQMEVSRTLPVTRERIGRTIWLTAHLAFPVSLGIGTAIAWQIGQHAPLNGLVPALALFCASAIGTYVLAYTGDKLGCLAIILLAGTLLRSVPNQLADLTWIHIPTFILAIVLSRRSYIHRAQLLAYPMDKKLSPTLFPDIDESTQLSKSTGLWPTLRMHLAGACGVAAFFSIGIALNEWMNAPEPRWIDSYFALGTMLGAYGIIQLITTFIKRGYMRLLKSLPISTGMLWISTIILPVSACSTFVGIGLLLAMIFGTVGIKLLGWILGAYAVSLLATAATIHLLHQEREFRNLPYMLGAFAVFGLILSAVVFGGGLIKITIGVLSISIGLWLTYRETVLGTTVYLAQGKHK